MKKTTKKVLRARRNASSELTLYANPYDISARGWYFKSAEEFDRKFAAHQPVEEYEIDFIDGNDFESELFKSMHVNQSNVTEYFERIEQIGDMRDHELAALHFALQELSMDDVDEALRLAQDEIRVTEGDAEKYAEDFIDNIGGVGELGEDTREMYFDYEKFGRDIRGDLLDSRVSDARYEARRQGEDEDEAEQEVIDEFDSIEDEDLGIDFVRDVGMESVGNAEFYFDMEAFARDLKLNGDVTEFEYLGKTWTTDYR
jgi:antirestriction protein